MLHSSMPAIADHPGLRSPYPIFRRRFLVEKPSSSISRCLFGIPDPKASFGQYDHVAEKSQIDFKKRWSFDPLVNLPLSGSDEGDHEMEIDYNWTELDVDGQEKTNEVAVAQEEISAAPASASIPEVLVQSTSAPSTENSKASEIKDVKIKVEKSPTPTPIALSPIGVFSPPNVQMESGSDEEERRSPVIGATSCGSCTATAVLEVVAHTPTSRRLVGSSGPVLRQRCITDYMKVKKASRTVKKVLR